MQCNYKVFDETNGHFILSQKGDRKQRLIYRYMHKVALGRLYGNDINMEQTSLINDTMIAPSGGINDFT